MPFARRAVAVFLLTGVSMGLVRAADLPRRAPEFTVSMLGGKQIALSQYRGKVVALLFILTYCPHCQKSVEALSKLQTEFGPRGFQVVGSAIEDMAAMALPDFLKRYNPSFPVGYNERGPVIDILQHPAMLKLLMPQIVFIDRTGMIRAQYSGDDKFFGEDQDQNLRHKVEELLAVSAHKSPASGARRRAAKK